MSRSNSTPISTTSSSSGSNSQQMSGYTSSSSSLGGTPGSRTSAKAKSPTPTTKPPNVFSNDGSFLDRIRRSMKEEEDKKKEKEALERKLHFADRFKNRGKRRAQSHDPETQGEHGGNTHEDEESPRKKPRVSVDGQDGTEEKDQSKEGTSKDNSAQAEYQKAMDSYPTSLKDSGTGVRSLVK